MFGSGRRAKLQNEPLLSRWSQEWRRLLRKWRSLRTRRTKRVMFQEINWRSHSVRLGLGLSVVAGLLIIWQIFSAYSTYQAQLALGTALDVDGIALATASLPDRPPVQQAQRDEMRARAEAVLRRDPLNARALRVLGQIADAEGNEPAAAALMTAASRRSLLETVAAFWLMQKSHERNDPEQTAYYADVILRTRPQLVAQVTPFLARIAEDKDPGDVLNKVLAANPPWRSAFLAAIPNHLSDPRTPLKLLTSLRETAPPPSTADLRNYIDFLIRHKLYEIAYYSWLQFLSSEELSKVGLLSNGDFESAPSGLPFDWVITQGSGVTLDIVPRPDEPKNHSLFIEFGYGRVEFNGVSQVIMLAPGAYRFAGRYKGELVGRRGLVWRLNCILGAPIGQSAIMTGTVSTWKEFDFSFTVPERDCRAQSVQLVLDARSASERFVSGSMWYDDLSISRIGRADAELQMPSR